MLTHYYGRIFIDSDEIETFFKEFGVPSGEYYASVWMRDVMNTLFKINTTATGRLVFDAMVKAPGAFNVHIRPLVDNHDIVLLQHPGLPNSPAHITMLHKDKKVFNEEFTEAVPEDWAGATTTGQTKPFLDGTSVTGTGGGSGAVVRFSACVFGQTSMFYPEDVLFHELFHSLRIMLGKIDQEPLTGAEAAYQNQEEFIAIMIANVFTSECDEARCLRGPPVNPPAWKELDAGEQDPNTFYKLHKELIDHLARRSQAMHKLFMDLGLHGEIAFNPFRAFRQAKIDDGSILGPNPLSAT